MSGDIVSLQTQGNQIFWIVFIIIYIVCIFMLTILVYYVGRWRLCKLFYLLMLFLYSDKDNSNNSYIIIIIISRMLILIVVYNNNVPI